MEVAPVYCMKASRIVLVLLPVTLSVFLWGAARLPVEGEIENGNEQLLANLATPAEPLSPAEQAPCVDEAPVAVEEPETPVQPLEERGDAMLFECEALYGTPFDQAITMPFD